MKAVLPELNNNSTESLYIQLFRYLRDGILSGEIAHGERLPSLRSLAEELGISVTTVGRAYDQLLIEGYVEAKPNSGFYVISDAGFTAAAPTGDAHAGAESSGADKRETDRSSGNGTYGDASAENSSAGDASAEGSSAGNTSAGDSPAEGNARKASDPSTFDFVKWKKCFSEVMNYDAEKLLSPAEPLGEPELREEIAEYLYKSRSVTADPEDIVISAGVQQLSGQIARMLRASGIELMNLEDPGYAPVRKMFLDRGLKENLVPVDEKGLDVSKLPVNLRSAVYVSPSNQFPTGTVMPASRRHELIKWAEANRSVIIEDDYDSELRYFGSPLPPLKSLDRSGVVIYLGSFSSTLFPAIRISYMLLPGNMAAELRAEKDKFDQTCSKEEQLILAKYMESGYYLAGIRKLRKLYSKKLSAIKKAINGYQEEHGSSGNKSSGRNGTSGNKASGPGGKVLSLKALDTVSGTSIRVETGSEEEAEIVSERLRDLGIRAVRLPGGRNGDKEETPEMLIYFDQIPLDEIEKVAGYLLGARGL